MSLMPGTLQVINSNGTYFKLRAEQARNLKKKELYKAQQGQKFQYTFIDEGEFGGHYKVHFTPEIITEDWPKGVQTWFVNPSDVDLTPHIIAH